MFHEINTSHISTGGERETTKIPCGKAIRQERSFFPKIAFSAVIGWNVSVAGPRRYHSRNTHYKNLHPLSIAASLRLITKNHHNKACLAFKRVKGYFRHAGKDMGNEEKRVSQDNKRLWMATAISIGWLALRVYQPYRH